MKLERTGWNCDEAQYARQRHDIRFSCDNQEVKNLCQKQAESRFNTRSMVPRKGLEPPRISTLQNLNLVRLPISPPGQAARILALD
jgi:hypothetical protein